MKVYLIAVALLLCGCSSPKQQSELFSAGELVQLNIITSPVGLDIDGRPGLDGFSAKVYANTPNNPKTVRIRGGVLEVLMFDGTLYGLTNVPPPLRIWTFPSEELRTHEFNGRIGTGYEFLLPWGGDRPTHRIITVAARYTSANGNVLTSRPSSVTVIDR